MASCETEGHLWPVAGHLTGGALYLLQGAGVVDLLRVQALSLPYRTSLLEGVSLGDKAN